MCPMSSMGVVFLLCSSRARVLKVQRGAYKLVKQCRTSRSPTLSYVAAFSFYSPRWGSHLHVSSAMSWHRRVSFVFVSRRGPLGQSGVGWLDPCGFSWAMGCPGDVPSLASRGGPVIRTDARGSSPVLFVWVYVPYLQGYLA